MNIWGMNTLKNKAEILDFFRENPDMMAILTIVRDLELKIPGWRLVRSEIFIWNLLSDKPAFDRETDVDVIFFDPDVSYEETLVIESKLREDFPQYQWELKNQVYMHQHSPHTPPYRNSCDAMSKYPERCTAVGLRLNVDATFELFAPYGLEDILNFQVAPTPHFLENEDRMKLYQSVYLRKIGKKNGKSHI